MTSVRQDTITVLLPTEDRKIPLSPGLACFPVRGEFFYLRPFIIVEISKINLSPISHIVTNFAVHLPYNEEQKEGGPCTTRCT